MKTVETAETMETMKKNSENLGTVENVETQKDLGSDFPICNTTRFVSVYTIFKFLIHCVLHSLPPPYVIGI